MKKRLRKKLGVGEFEEMVFDFFAKVSDATNEEVFNKFLEAIEAADFCCEGTWDEEAVDLYVSTGLKNTDNEARKVKFMEAVAAITELSEAKASDLY